MSKTDTIVKMARDGTLSRVRGGRKVVVKPARPKAMTEAEVLAAAKAVNRHGGRTPIGALRH